MKGNRQRNSEAFHSEDALKAPSGMATGSSLCFSFEGCYCSFEGWGVTVYPASAASLPVLALQLLMLQSLPKQRLLVWRTWRVTLKTLCSRHVSLCLRSAPQHRSSLLVEMSCWPCADPSPALPWAVLTVGPNRLSLLHPGE